jgi:superfamily I DNA/RNA helicase
MTHFSRVRTEVIRYLRGGLFDARMYDFVMVDEGQDLTAEAFELINLVAEHVTVCVDHKQQIYEVGSTEDEILDRLGLRRRNLSLLSTFRCTPYIVDLASRLVEDPVQRQENIRQCRITQNGRETPLLYIAKDLEDEMDRLAEVLRTRLGMGERVAILTPRTRQMFGVAKGLGERGIDVETKRVLDFTSNRPKVMPYPSAKGLTFDSVLMPRLTDKSFEKEDDERVERLLFVGITRAMKWVYMSSTDPNSLAPLDTLGEAEDAGSLEIQTGGTRPQPPRAPATDDDEKGDDALIDLL